MRNAIFAPSMEPAPPADDADVPLLLPELQAPRGRVRAAARRRVALAAGVVFMIGPFTIRRPSRRGNGSSCV
jgi:hypothetical protein